MAYRLVETKPEEEIPIEQEEAKESVHQNLLRHATRSAARGLETTIGMPADILSTIISLGTKAGSALGMGDEGSKERAEMIQSYLPTSEKIKEKVTEPIFGEYTKPKGKAEEISDEIVSTGVALLNPLKGPKAFSSGKKLLKAFGMAAGSEAASEAVGFLGAKEKGKAAAKLGSMLMLGLVGKAKPQQLKSDLYTEAKKSLKDSPKVSSPTLQNTLRRLKKDVSKGLGAPSEKAVLSNVEKLQNKFKNGKIEVEELWASKRSLNEELQKIIVETQDKAAIGRARSLLKTVNIDIGRELKKYGKKNPKFGVPFKEAEEIHGAIEGSKMIGKFIKGKAKYSPLSPLLYPIVKNLHSSSIPVAVALGGAYKGAQLVYKMARSPTLAKHYASVLKNAAKENAPAMNRSLRQMDQELQKEKNKEDSGRYKLVS